MAENSRPGNEYVGARLGHRADIVDFYPAIDLNVDLETAPLDLAPDRAQLLQALGDEALPAEARVHTHHQNHIEVLRRGEHPINRRLRIDPNRSARAKLVDSRGDSRQIVADLRMHRDRISAGLDEGPQVARGLRDHQVGVERQPGYLAQRFQHRHADREIWYE